MSDPFYRDFEDRYRGSREVIGQRLRAYLPFIEPLAALQRPAAPLPAGPGQTAGTEATAVPTLPGGGGDLAAWERAMLELALRETGGNQTKAAQRLGITRDTLRYRLKKFGLQG